METLGQFTICNLLYDAYFNYQKGVDNFAIEHNIASFGVGGAVPLKKRKKNGRYTHLE